jgi:hypothetical protein
MNAPITGKFFLQHNEFTNFKDLSSESDASSAAFNCLVFDYTPESSSTLYHSAA